jgi:hypothetical protein
VTAWRAVAHVFEDDDDWIVDDPLLSPEPPTRPTLSATLEATGQERRWPNHVGVVVVRVDSRK